MSRYLPVFLGGLLVLLASSPPRVGAQKKVAETFVAAPQSPTLTSPVNLGLARGTAVELTLTGANLLVPTGVLVGAPLRASIPTDLKNGTLAGKLRVKVEAPAETPIGLYPIRVATNAGVSNFRPLVVDELPEIAEVETNRTKELAQKVPAPCVVLGRADTEAVDFFQVEMKAGQRLTFEVLGRRLGSPIDPIIVLHDGKTRREMVDQYADDTPGLQADARLTYTARDAGAVIVEVRDTTYRGGPDYFYRLRIGDFPGATTAFPLAMQRGKTLVIGFSGPSVNEILPATVTAPTDPNATALRVAPRRATGASGWPVPVILSDYPELVEQEPNDDPAQAQLLPVPGGVSARFGRPNDLDYFKIAGKKGQKLAIAALAYEVNAPTEVLIRIVDKAGRELAKSDPALAAARTEFTPSADGDYFIVCEHLNYLSGPHEVYHLSVRPAAPDFALVLPLDRAEAPVGGGTAVLVNGIARTNGFAGPIELTVLGDPALSGSIVVPAGATSAYVPLLIKPGTRPGPYSFQIQGRATIEGREVRRLATTTDLAKAALAGLPNPPPELLGLAAVAAIEKPPFALVATSPVPIEKGKTGKLVVEVTRNGFDGEIALASVFATPNVTVAPKPVAKGAMKGELDVTIAAGASPGPAVVVLKGTAKVAGKDYVVTAAPARIEVTTGKGPKKEDPKPKEKKFGLRNSEFGMKHRTDILLTPHSEIRTPQIFESPKTPSRG